MRLKQRTKTDNSAARRVRIPKEVRECLAEAHGRAFTRGPSRLYWDDLTESEKALVRAFVKELHSECDHDCDVLAFDGCASCDDCDAGDAFDSQWVYYAHPEECPDECWMCNDCPDGEADSAGSTWKASEPGGSRAHESTVEFIDLRLQIARKVSAWLEGSPAWDIEKVDYWIIGSSLELGDSPIDTAPVANAEESRSLQNCLSDPVQTTVRLEVRTTVGETISVTKGVKTSRTVKGSVRIPIDKGGKGTIGGEIQERREISLTTKEQQSFQRTITVTDDFRYEIPPYTKVLFRSIVNRYRRIWPVHGHVTVDAHVSIRRDFDRVPREPQEVPGLNSLTRRITLSDIYPAESDRSFEVEAMLDNATASKIKTSVSAIKLDPDGDECKAHKALSTELQDPLFENETIVRPLGLEEEFSVSIIPGGLDFVPLADAVVDVESNPPVAQEPSEPASESIPSAAEEPSEPASD